MFEMQAAVAGLMDVERLQQRLLDVMQSDADVAALMQSDPAACLLALSEITVFPERLNGYLDRPVVCERWRPD